MKTCFLIFVIAGILIISGCDAINRADGPETQKLKASFTFEVQVTYASAPSAGVPNATVYLRAIKNNEPDKQFDWTYQSNQDGWVIAKCGYNFNYTFDKVDFYASLTPIDQTDFTSPTNYLNRYWTSVSYDRVQKESNVDRSAEITVTGFLRQE